MIETRNMILAIALSVLIVVGFNFYKSRQLEEMESAQTTGQATTAPPGQVPTPSDTAVPQPGAPVPATVIAAPQAPSREDVLSSGQRVRINSPELHGSIALTGAKLDDLTLANYRETIFPTSPEIVLLSPPGAANTYFAQFGWVSTNASAVPGADTVWKADGKVLDPGSPLTLTWDNGDGLRFSRTIALDENYMFTVTQSVVNTSPDPVTLHSYGLVSRWGTPPVTRFFILHEGLLGVFNETLEEVDYDDLQETGKIEKTTTGGWIGITDKYWLTALVPDQQAEVKSRFTHHRENGNDRYQIDFLGHPMTVAPGATHSVENRFFAGVKQVKLLDAYSENLGIDRFDLAIDFGWFYFLTKPIFYLLIYINNYVGNFGIAILLLTVMIKIIFFPLANKSYRSMSKMKKLQPEMMKLRERFADDKQRLNQEMMALYRNEKANPASGCLPMVIQIPVFFALYKVLFVTIEMRHAPFYGWIHDLSAQDPTSLFNLFGLIPWDPTSILPAIMNIGAWPLIMGITMFLQQKLNPQPADPVQAKIFMFLPLMFTFMLAQFPAGLVIYWAWNNMLSIIQQWMIMKRAGAT